MKTNYIITRHAIKRFIIRAHVCPKDAKNKLKQKLFKSKPVCPSKKWAASALLRNNFRMAYYRKSGNIVFVLVGETKNILATVYKDENNNFIPLWKVN